MCLKFRKNIPFITAYLPKYYNQTITVKENFNKSIGLIGLEY